MRAAKGAPDPRTQIEGTRHGGEREGRGKGVGTGEGRESMGINGTWIDHLPTLIMVKLDLEKRPKFFYCLCPEFLTPALKIPKSLIDI